MNNPVQFASPRSGIEDLLTRLATRCSEIPSWPIASTMSRLSGDLTEIYLLHIGTLAKLLSRSCDLDEELVHEVSALMEELAIVAHVGSELKQHFDSVSKHLEDQIIE